MEPARVIEVEASPERMFYPLEYFYIERAVALPSLTCVPGWDVPHAQRELLVHDRDMTPTLEAAYGSRLQLRVLRYTATSEAVNRMVALRVDCEPEPVGIGAIRIFLTRLPALAQERVLERREPFGRILEQTGVAHFSRPVAYFHLIADAVVQEALGMRGPEIVYGRCSTLWNAAGVPLADVVEILPPTKSIEENGRMS